MNKKTRVFIVDDHPAMRHGIAQLIARENDLEMCGETGGMRAETLQALAKSSVDFIVLDIALKESDRSGLEMIPEILGLLGNVPILIYSMFDEKTYAERALRAGARGYLMKQEPVRLIVHAIRTITRDGIYVSEALSRSIVMNNIGTSKRQQTPNTLHAFLSKREQEVFQLIGKGMQPRIIAEKLCISAKTVETHRMNIRKKLNMPNAALLAQYAVEHRHLIS